eukprot:12215795-Alexandrium_andersonii.AAC.1
MAMGAHPTHTVAKTRAIFTGVATSICTDMFEMFGPPRLRKHRRALKRNGGARRKMRSARVDARARTMRALRSAHPRKHARRTCARGRSKTNDDSARRAK